MMQRSTETWISIETLHDVSLHPDMHCFDNALKRLYSNNKPPQLSGVATNDNYISETASLSDWDEIEKLRVPR